MVKEANSDIKKFWDFLWNDESIWGWLVSLAVIFIFIKFIFFPGLSAVLGTNLPLVVVESESMSHQAFIFGEFEPWWNEHHQWYQERGITKQEARMWTLKSGLEKGDIAAVVGYRNSEPRIGDIIVFNAGQIHPIIHRIINIEERNGETYYSTKGDGNSDQISLDRDIKRDQIIGRAILKLPKLGWIKLLVVQIF